MPAQTLELRFLEAIGQLRRQAKARGIQLTDLDRLLGHHPSYLAKVLAQDHRIPIETFLRLLRVLDVDPGWFFRDVYPPQVPLPEIGLLPTLAPDHAPLHPHLGALATWWTDTSVEPSAPRPRWSPEPRDLQHHLDGGKYDVAFAHALFMLTWRPEAPVLCPHSAQGLTHLLLVLADICRQLSCLRNASHAVDLAFRIEEHLGDLSLRAEIFQRAADVLGDLGHPRHAHCARQQAAMLSLYCDRPADQGLFEDDLPPPVSDVGVSDYRDALGLLRRQMEQLGWTRTQLDLRIGASQGYLCDVLRERQSLNLSSIFATLEATGKDPGWYFQRIHPPGIPKADVGFLLTRVKPSRRRSLLDDVKTPLIQWVDALSIDSQAPAVAWSQDPTLVTSKVNADPRAAAKMALDLLDGPVSGSAQLQASDAEVLARLLTDLGASLRLQGQRYTAALSFDLAFRIEALLDNLPLRAFIFRAAAYLLNDLAHPADAESYAERAVALARHTADHGGLSRSLYVQAAIAQYRTHFRRALHLYRRCLFYLPEPDAPISVSIRFAIAYLQLQQGDLMGLETELDSIQPLDLLHHGFLVATKAELRSQQDRPAEADQLFEQATGLFSKAVLGGQAASDDFALFKLRHILHLVRHHDDRVAIEARQLHALSEDLADYPIGQAALLEVARLAFRGELTKQGVLLSIRELEVSRQRIRA